VNLENVQHDFAVATLKATKQQVQLLIGRQSYSATAGSSTQPVAQPAHGLYRIPFVIDFSSETWLNVRVSRIPNKAPNIQ